MMGCRCHYMSREESAIWHVKDQVKKLQKEVAELKQLLLKEEE